MHIVRFLLLKYSLQRGSAFPWRTDKGVWPRAGVPALEHCSSLSPLVRGPTFPELEPGCSQRPGSSHPALPTPRAPVPSENSPPVASVLLAPARSQTEPSRTPSLRETCALLQIREFSLSILPHFYTALLFLAGMFCGVHNWMLVTV